VKRVSLAALATTALGPLVALGLSAVLGAVVAGERRGTLFTATAKLSAARKSELELAAPLSITNATWRLGTGASAERALKATLDQLPDTGALRARLLLRLAAVVDNPEGQAALINQACGADPSICDQLREATARELVDRLVPPNGMPLYFVGHHPAIFH
jgi:hypothetical protein